MSGGLHSARNRYLAMTLVRIAGSAGAVFGLVVLARAGDTWTRVLGAAIVLAALYMIATVPRAMARQWRTRDE
ncbi:hypothetical protein KY084_11670 [Stakelama sp. CBK3Z-3]|uniref:DUF2892 domain-containing protein n=1 Tax=Stakelama flava TaxID=2860338 RepID=A0ABS6XMW1_9SPHN|nr:hypothetical protein [Stakelama flava]MBW4331526.1 hypothetical protein [Stakelama flava]